MSNQQEVWILSKKEKWMSPQYNEMKRGDRVRFRGNAGTLLTDAKYEIDKLHGYTSSGLHYADIKWDDGYVDKQWLINRVGLEWVPKHKLKSRRKRVEEISERTRQRMAAKADRLRRIRGVDYV